MKHIVFLDDSDERSRMFGRRIFESNSYDENICVRSDKTANACIETIKYVTQDLREEISVLFLDHDLGGEIYVDSGREDCGMEVVRWLVENKPPIGRIIVHTHNIWAADTMAGHLRHGAGYEKVEVVPFSVLFDYLEINPVES